MRPCAPKLREGIEVHPNERNAGGLTLPEGSGRPLQFRLTRKEQASERISERPETNKFNGTRNPASFRELNLLNPASNSRSFSEV